MFTLQHCEIDNFNLQMAREFVEFWSQFYDYRVPLLNGEGDIDYFAELNVDGKLDQQNISRLLRWKDPRLLTETTLHGKNKGKQNNTVAKVVALVAKLNEFRQGSITDCEARCMVDGIFKQGIVYRVFLLHIAKPHLYPMGDQHVFRVFALHNRTKVPTDWSSYDCFRRYFAKLAAATGVDEELKNVRDLKRIDNALMAFGQFLKKYGSSSLPTE